MSNNIPDEKKNDSQLNYVVISYSLAEYADATSYIEKIQSFGLRVRLCADNIDISKRTADITGASALIVLMTKGETNRRIFRDDLECAANAGKPRIFCAYYDENEKNAIEKALGERSIRILNLSECHDKNLTDFAGKLFIDNAAAVGSALSATLAVYGTENAEYIGAVDDVHIMTPYEMYERGTSMLANNSFEK